MLGVLSAPLTQVPFLFVFLPFLSTLKPKQNEQGCKLEHDWIPSSILRSLRSVTTLKFWEALETFVRLWNGLNSGNYNCSLCRKTFVVNMFVFFFSNQIYSHNELFATPIHAHENLKFIRIQMSFSKKELESTDQDQSLKWEEEEPFHQQNSQIIFL